MRSLPKRVSFRHMLGKELMRCVPSYELKAGDLTPVTAARHYVANHGIKPPALLLVNRNEHTVDRFYWSIGGMYGAMYAEMNYLNFSCLSAMRKDLTQSLQIEFEKMNSSLPFNAELESYRYEFAFI